MNLKRKSSEGEDFDEAIMLGAQCPVYKRVKVINEYDIIIDEDITEPAYYRNAFATLRGAGEEDRVNVYINTSGGSLATAIMFRNAMEDSAAEVWSILEGEAHSAGSMIALSANAGMQVKSHASMMIHNAKFGTVGTVQNIVDQVAFSKNYTDRIIRDVYADFLTEQEIQDVIKNKEVWLDEFEIGKRIQAMYRTRAERMQAQMDEEEKSAGTTQEASLEEAEEQVEASPVKKTARKKKGA